MIIKTLIENTSISKDFCSEHGLSLYIEMQDHKILFDTGASELFLQNAKKLNINIADIDYLIISHGHYDHGGGLKTFLNENKKATVFLNHLAFEKYYSLRENDNLEFIGLDESLKQNKQIKLISDKFIINDGIEIFSNIAQKEPLPRSNSNLFKEENGKIIKDDFLHEQNLIIEEEGKSLLIMGCAHNGIVNILKYYESIKGKMPDFVIGGFHLSSRSGIGEDKETIEKIANYLLSTKAKFYTCHCTGEEAYIKLKDIMGSSIDYLSAGSKIAV